MYTVTKSNKTDKRTPAALNTIIIEERFQPENTKKYDFHKLFQFIELDTNNLNTDALYKQ